MKLIKIKHAYFPPDQVVGLVRAGGPTSEATIIRFVGGTSERVSLRPEEVAKVLGFEIDDPLGNKKKSKKAEPAVKKAGPKVVE